MSHKQIIDYFTGTHPNFPNIPVFNNIEDIVRLMPDTSKTTNDRAMISITVDHIARNEAHINDREAIRMATTYFLSLLQHRENRNQRDIYKNLALNKPYPSYLKFEFTELKQN
ncbi:833_t:CDS:2 [Cetraspora pellucida]|uniref:833_t:CDS:1 n=1 Tax=Cetraspora pellucida TaxID=1433469 RepID=A0A9N8ZV18_9GLOM|nr:833_t:CDS:2 [Cetraspora pellucida]